MAYQKQSFRNGQKLEASHLNAMENGIAAATLETYAEQDGVATITNPVSAANGYWTKYNGRLAFGMDTAEAPVPVQVNGQMYVDGTLIVRNRGWDGANRWCYHVFEAYAVNNQARITMLLDKHSSETEGKPSAEFYYYIGADHFAPSYGNLKIGSDVKYHSFCFDRDKMTAYGEVDMKMPITLARVSLSNDLITTYDTVAAADSAYEPENQPEQNNKCLKFIALKNAQNGAMFYDVDRNKVVCKVNGKWCDIPVTEITDASYDIFDDTPTGGGDTTSVLTIDWESGVIGGYGDTVANSARLRTAGYLPSNVGTVTANSGYEFALIVLDSNGWADNCCYYNPTTGSKGDSPQWVTSLDVGSVSIDGYPNKKLIARRTDLGNIAATEGVNIVVTSASGSGGSSSGVETYSVAWESGVIGAYGDEVANSGRIRTTGYLPSGAKKIVANNNFDVCALFLNSDGGSSGSPYYNPTTGSLSNSVVWATSVDLTDVSFEGLPNIRLIAKRQDFADITASDGSNIVITSG